MISIDYRVETIGPITHSIAQTQRLINHNTVAGINSTLAGAKKIAQEPIPSGPSGIRKSVQTERAKLSTATGRLKTTHPLFGFVEENTRPHVIAPKTKTRMVGGKRKGGVLAFKARGFRQLVFAKYVVHPGTQGKHSFRRANEFVEKYLPLYIKLGLDAAIDGRQIAAIESAVLSGLLLAA